MSAAPTREFEPPAAGPSSDLFGFVRAVMWVANMCPLGLDRFLPPLLHIFAHMLDVLLEIFSYFVMVHIAILHVCTLYLYYKDGDLEFLVNCVIQTIIYFWAITMKLYFRRIQPQRLKELMEYINLNYKTRSSIGLTYVTMDECLAMANRWCKVYVYSCFIGTVFWLVLPIAYGDRSLPLTCWYPFDYKESIVYETMYFFQLIGQLQVAASFSVSSGFYMVLAILISGQYDVLNCSLKNIVANVYINIGASKEELVKLKKLQGRSGDEVNQYYCAKEHPLLVEFMPRPKLQLMPLTREPKPMRADFRLAFRTCVDHHRYVLGALARMEAFYNSIWFLKTGEVIFLMCLVAFVSVKSTTANSSFMKIISLGQYLLLVAWELLIICYFGEIIHINSRRCGEALLRSPWHLHMDLMRTDMLIFLLNSQRSFKLTAGKIYTLNVDRFRAIITTAFSFLTLLQKMDNRI